MSPPSWSTRTAGSWPGNTAATGFFGIPAWQASAHTCARVVLGRACADPCPQLHSGRARGAAPTTFDLGGVPALAVRHTPVHAADGELVGMAHLITKAAAVTTGTSSRPGPSRYAGTLSS